MSEYLDRLQRRVLMMFGFARSSIHSSEAATPSVQVSFVGTKSGGAEVKDNVPSMQIYGFASATLAGADYAIGFMSGDRSKGVAIASNDRRYRPTTLKPGEAMMYDNIGNEVYLSQSGLVIKGASSLTFSAGGHKIVIGSAGIFLDDINFGTHIHGNGNDGANTTAPVAGS